MNESFVVDASVTIAWVHPAQATAGTDALLEALEGGAIVEVPAVWPLEVANALLVLARRKRLTEAQRLRALAALGEIAPVIDTESVRLALTTLSTLASRHGLSVYDACYLELAMRKKLPLACKDAPLRKAAKRCQVKLLLPV